jgi:malate synthase
VWQWVHLAAATDDGRTIDRERVRAVLDEELAAIRAAAGDDEFAKGRFEDARSVFEDVALGDPFVEFLTLPAYELID